MPEPREMISVDHLTKRYGPHTAVNDISFSVDKGQVLGFLGPNGAGKSTTMKILTTFLSPTAGRARIAGLDVWDHPLEVRRKIGYLPEDTPLYKDMAIAEYLGFVCEVRKLPRSSRKAAVRRVAEQCGIADIRPRWRRIRLCRATQEHARLPLPQPEQHGRRVQSVGL